MVYHLSNTQLMVGIDDVSSGFLVGYENHYSDCLGLPKEHQLNVDIC